MQYLRADGPAARPILNLNIGLLAISLIVCLIVAICLLLAIFRKRAPVPGENAGKVSVLQASSGMKWLYIGGGLSTIVLFLTTIWTIMTLSAIAAPPDRPAVSIEVTGYQWWWEAKYQIDGMAEPVRVANEIHIPVGQPVQLTLVGGDVIHSFWVPALAGKTDMIPGKINTQWLQADKPGIYRGQCSEYCGEQHAHMALEVVADEPSRFEEWRRQQAKPALASNARLALQGSRLFESKCSECHTIRGTEAHGEKGPDLTHLMSRSTLASGMLANNTGNLSGWVANAQSLKPGSRMPPVALSPDELHSVVAYLQTLQ